MRRPTRCAGFIPTVNTCGRSWPLFGVLSSWWATRTAAVITAGGTSNPNIKALVYVAAYAPDEGETLAQINDLGGGAAELTSHFVVRPYAGAAEGDGDGYIDPAHFHRLFCADVDDELASVMALSQRGVALSALVTPPVHQPGRPYQAFTWWPPTTRRSRLPRSASWPDG